MHNRSTDNTSGVRRGRFWTWCFGLTSSAAVCPFCGGSALKKAGYREYRHRLFLVRRPLKCLSCGAVFMAPCRLFSCAAAGLIGIAIGAAALTWDVVPSIKTLLSVGFALRGVVGLLVGMIGMLFAGWIVFVAIATAKYSASYSHRVQHTTEETETK